MADDLITTKEAAEILDIVQASVNRHCRNGTFRTAKLMGGVWLISKGEVEEYAQKVEGLSKFNTKRGSSLE